MRIITNPGTTALLVLGLLQTPAVLAAQERTPRPPAPGAAPVSVVDFRGQLGASINNAGAQLSFELSRRRPLSRSRHPLLSEAHVGLAEPAYYFGTFDSLTSFDSRRNAFDGDSRRERGGAVSGTTTRFYVTPTLRLRARRFIGLASADLEWWSSNAAGPFFYEPTRDTLLDPGGDRLTTVTSAVLYEHPLATGHLTAGIAHSRMRVRGGSLNQIQRLGVVAIRQFDGRVLSLDRPSVTINASRYLDDPFKQGEWTASMAIGFSLHR